MLNLRQMEVFEAVMRTGSVTAAANVLNITQSAVSRIILYTEDQIKIELFQRIKGRLHPTPEAYELFGEVQKVFRRIETVRHMAADLRNGVSGRVVVATTVSLGSSLVPAAIKKFREVYSDVCFAVHALATRHVIEMVVDGEADIGLVFAPAADRLLDHQDVGEAELVCVMPSSHALASLPQVTPKDIEEYPLITGYRGRHFGPLLEEAFRTAGSSPTICSEVTTSHIACELVAQGVGIALADPYAVPNWNPILVKRPFVPRIAINPRVVFLREQRMSQIAAAFIPYLKCEGESPSWSFRNKAAAAD